VLKPDQLPQEVDKATVYVHGDIIMVTGHATIDTQQIEDNQDFWVTWRCEYSLEGDAKALKQAIEDGKAVAVSDGSFQCRAGAAAWTIEGTMAENRIQGAGQTPGGEEDQSPYRSELFGLWGIFAALKRSLRSRQSRKER